MAIDGIYTYQQTTGGPGVSIRGNGLGMDDFFKLMVAQLSNQDMFNTVDDTQFITQMAQFSMLQAVNDLSRASATSYSVSLIGKEATVAQVESEGGLQVHTGIVDSVIFYNGSPQIIIDGQKYELSNIMEVKEPDIIIPKNDFIEDTEGKEPSQEGNEPGVPGEEG